MTPSSSPAAPGNQTPPPLVLSFAATDPTGGAGLQADLLAVSALGCHGLSVVTAVTVQDTSGVEGVLPLEASWITEQARTLLEDMPVAAFKIGVLGSVEALIAVAEVIADYPDVPVVLDPVLASGRGDAFGGEEVTEALGQVLLPLTHILTPNSIEARALAAEGQDNVPLDECARRLVSAGADYVLITGTHEATAQVSNVLYGTYGPVRRDAWPRLPGSYHGSGCTLASAIAACLARGMPLEESVREAQQFTWDSLAAGFRPGMGQFIPQRLHQSRELEVQP